MAVTTSLTVQALAVAMRLTADTLSTLEDPLLGIVARQRGAAVEILNAYGVSDDIPQATFDHAVVMLASFMYEVSPASSNSQDPLRMSGAAGIVSPWHVSPSGAIA